VSFAVMQRRRCRLVLGFDRDFLLAGFELYAR
jgi:predicted nucleic acid-binding protein